MKKSCKIINCVHLPVTACINLMPQTDAYKYLISENRFENKSTWYKE